MEVAARRRMRGARHHPGAALPQLRNRRMILVVVARAGAFGAASRQAQRVPDSGICAPTEAPRRSTSVRSFSRISMAAVLGRSSPNIMGATVCEHVARSGGRRHHLMEDARIDADALGQRNGLRCRRKMNSTAAD